MEGEITETKHEAPKERVDIASLVKSKMAELKETDEGEAKPEAPEKRSTVKDSVKKAYIAEGKAPEADTTEKEASKEKPVQKKGDVPDDKVRGDKKADKETTPEGKEKKATEAPTSWSKKDREAFAKADPELQKTIAKRETERDKKLLDVTRSLSYAEKALKELEPVNEHMKELRAEAKRIGKTPAELVKSLLGVQERSVKNPIGYAVEAASIDPLNAVKAIVQQFNIDLNELARGNDIMAFDQQGHAQSREYQQLQHRYNMLEQQFNQMQQGFTESSRQSETHRVALALETVLSTKDPEEAELVVPYLQHAVNLVQIEAQQAGQVLTTEQAIEKAYQNAMLIVPSLRERTLAAQQASKAEEEQRQREEQLAKSRAAAISPNGHTPAARGKRKLTGTLKKKVKSIVSDAYRQG